MTHATFTTPLFAAVLLLLVSLLGLNVSLLRMRLKISLGDGGNKGMLQAIRAHANALEHSLPVILLVFFREQQVGCTRGLTAIAAAFVLGRVFHAAGMLGGPFILRRIGATTTILVELGLGLLVLRSALA